MQQILVVDDEIGIRELLSEILRDEGYTVKLAENASQAREARTQLRPDLVLLDIWMPDTDGVTLLKEWAAGGLLTMPVVMMSGHGTIDTAVEATRIGAYDFLEKPIALAKLLATVERALRRGERSLKPAVSLAMLGHAPVIAELKQRLERIRNLRTPVLLTAEPGAGAELCARFLHHEGTPWVALDNASRLAEAPLDLANEARDGTLFLYELSDLSRLEQKGLLLLTAKLDRYNVRIVCASSRALAELVAAGQFDAKLFSAISALTVPVAPLREHRDDIPELANTILAGIAQAKEAPLKPFSLTALNVLRNHDWPSNLAQLESVVKSLALTSLGDEITPEDVDRVCGAFETQPAARTSGLTLDLPLREARDAFERVYFEYHIGREGGNMSRVAERVGLERTHLYRKLKQLSIKLSKKNED